MLLLQFWQVAARPGPDLLEKLPRSRAGNGSHCAALLASLCGQGRAHQVECTWPGEPEPRACAHPGDRLAAIAHGHQIRSDAACSKGAHPFADGHVSNPEHAKDRRAPCGRRENPSPASGRKAFHPNGPGRVAPAPCAEIRPGTAGCDSSGSGRDPPGSVTISLRRPRLATCRRQIPSFPWLVSGQAGAG